MEIKNIIFDLGGVIYDIRYENIPEAFLAHGVTNLNDLYTRTQQTHEMDLFEEGLLSAQQVRQGLRQMANAPLTDQDVDDILNAILVDVPARRVDLLLALKKRYRLFLYSNTNEINYNYYVPLLRRKFGFDIFDRCFQAAYFSHLMHIRKPKPEGFRLILSQHGLRPEETLFIDDNAPNLTGAASVGIQTLWLRDELCSLFDDEHRLRSI